MKAASLFSGIGAPEAAMPHWDWLWHAEIEKFPSRVMAVRHPRSANLGDVNAPDFVERAARIGRPDVLVFGSPCQDFSVAGRRVGLDGERGNLALVGLRVAFELGVRWLAFENVPGLLSSYSGSAAAERQLQDRIDSGDGAVGECADCLEDSDFAAFLSAARERGYFGAYRVFDAQFARVPQRRRRVFFVGRAGDWRPAAAVLFEPESMRGDPAPGRAAGQGTAATLTVGASRGQPRIELDSGSTLIPEVAATVVERTNKGIDSSNSGQTLIPVHVPALNPTLTSSFNSTGGGDRAPGTSADSAEGLIVYGFPQRTRGDDGRGYDREPAFNRDAFPTIDAVKPPGVVAFQTRGSNLGVGDVAGTIGGAAHSPSGSAPMIAFDCKAGGDTSFSISEYTAGTLRGDGNGGGHAAVAFQTRVARNGRGGGEADLVPALNGSDAGATSDMRPCVAVFKPSHFTRGKDGAPADVAPALSADADKGDQDSVVMQGVAVRRLTPLECERLQAIPDNYTRIPIRKVSAKNQEKARAALLAREDWVAADQDGQMWIMAADGPRYRALGNSMHVGDIRWVLQRIERFEREVPPP